MSLRPSDIAIALSRDARELLQACCAGYCWVLSTAAGGAAELLQAALIKPKDAMSGRGYVVLPSDLGKAVAAELGREQ